jgi:hypothetical protein
MRALLLLLPACYLPVATGAPESATTVGAGHVGFAMNAEGPSLDLIAKNHGSGDDSYTSTYGDSPAAAARLTLAIGLADNTDLEIAAEGQLMFYFIPLPTGASIGLRQHLVTTDAFDIALAARFGGVTSSNDGNHDTDSAFNTDYSASAYYGALSAVVQARHGVFRPLASVNVMPFRISRSIQDEPVQRFTGAATSLTVAFMFVGDRVQFGPYATLTNFESEEFKGGFFPAGGLMLAFRPDRERVPLQPVSPPQP